MLDSFVLEGVRYWQEYRKCGKSSCRVCRLGPGHGPYWWARGLDGRRVYIGRELPGDVAAVRQAFQVLFLQAYALYKQRDLEARVLWKFLSHESLTQDEKRVIRDLGFGDALL